MHRIRLEILLILAVSLLIGQIRWPTLAHWWRRPSPGTVGVEQFQTPSLAPDYLIYLPNDDLSEPYPLIVFLHGSGERGNDISLLFKRGPFAFIAERENFPAMISAPPCLPNLDWKPDAVTRFVEHIASAYPVDKARIYLVGFSMGGFGVWRTASAHPGLFAAIIPIAGGGAPRDVKTLVDLPIWAFHGAKDDLVPVTESQKLVESIRALGGKPKLTVLPNGGHGICESVCSRTDVWEWLFRQTLHDRKNRHTDSEPTFSQ